MITKYFRLFLFFFLIGNLLISCKNKSISTRLVSVSILPQKYLTEQIAGDYLTVNVMIPPGMNPATCDLSTEQLKKLYDSDLCFTIGYLPFEQIHLFPVLENRPDIQIVNHSANLQLIHGSCGHTHAAGDEHAALLRGHRLGEHGGDDGDAGAHAEAGDQAERREEGQVVGEGLRQREEAVEHDRHDERLLAPQLVGQDAADGAAEHHAEQAPRGERAHERARVGVVGPEGVGHEQVRRVDDHEVIAVEDHGEAQDHEDDPGMRADANGVDDFRDSELFLVHQSLLLRMRWSMQMLDRPGRQRRRRSP